MRNIYNVPAWVILCCEMREDLHQRILDPRGEWRPAEYALHLQAPPQGFEADGLVRRWISSGLENDLAVLARCQYIERLLPGEPWHDTSKQST